MSRVCHPVGRMSQEQGIAATRRPGPVRRGWIYEPSVAEESGPVDARDAHDLLLELEAVPQGRHRPSLDGHRYRVTATGLAAHLGQDRPPGRSTEGQQHAAPE